MGAQVIRASFDTQMARLVGLKFPPTTTDTHWEALRDMPDALLEAAVTKAQGECEEFPAPIILRGYADQVRSRVITIPEVEDRGVDAPQPLTVKPPIGKPLVVTRYWNYYCDDCHDNGFRSYWCGVRRSIEVVVLPGRACGRHREHGGHEWVERCPCRATNPDILRRNERAAQTPARGSATK